MRKHLRVWFAVMSVFALVVAVPVEAEVHLVPGSGGGFATYRASEIRQAYNEIAAACNNSMFEITQTWSTGGDGLASTYKCIDD